MKEEYLRQQELEIGNSVLRQADGLKSDQLEITTEDRLQSLHRVAKGLLVGVYQHLKSISDEDDANEQVIKQLEEIYTLVFGNTAKITVRKGGSDE